MVRLLAHIFRESVGDLNEFQQGYKMVMIIVIIIIGFVSQKQ